MSSSTIETTAIPEQALRLLVEAAPDMMVLLQPDGRCRHVSPASMSLLGHAPGALSGTDLRDLVIEDDQHAVGDLLDRLGAGERCATVSLRVRRNGGGWVWMEGNARRVPAGAGAVLALRDITARKEGEAVLEEANSLLRRRASEDPATGLANRGHFIAGLERELRRARRDGVGLSVLAVEVEAFSLLGELYGHDPAEETVCKVAETLRCVMRRPGDIGGRLSGGVLGLMLPATVTGGAAEVASRLVEGVDELRLEHAGVPSGLLSVKIGVVYSLPNSGSAELVNAAEQAARKSRQPDRGEP
jgi:diguanylate cyclase (GGDEF)-like protein/PAS domain S-box-containing protein